MRVMLTLPTENTDIFFPRVCAGASSIGAALDRIEALDGVVAGLVPATPKFKVWRKHNRGGRDKPGHDPATGVGRNGQRRTAPRGGGSRGAHPPYEELAQHRRYMRNVST